MATNIGVVAHLNTKGILINIIIPIIIIIIIMVLLVILQIKYRCSTNRSSQTAIYLLGF